MRRLYNTRHKLVRAAELIESGGIILSNSARNCAPSSFKQAHNITAAGHYHSYSYQRNRMTTETPLQKLSDKQTSNEEKKPMATASSSRQRRSRRRGQHGGATASSGRGRSASANIHTQSPRRKSNQASKTINVITSDFSSVHKECRAARYKVHKPGCHCAKVKNVRSSLQQKQQVSQDDLVIETLDGLLVIPDIKNIPSVYLCLGTTSEEYTRDPIAAEQTLKEETVWPIGC